MPRSIRLVSFNILEGFRPSSASSSERRLIDRDRAAAARAVVADLAPDILVLNEALFCRQYAGRTVDYGSLFDFPFQSAALYDDAWGNAILSRSPIVKSREMRIYNRGGLIAIIDTPGGQLSVASYHPHPGRYPENKALDFGQLVDGLTGPVIVCGDLNCISPEEHIDRRQMIEAFRSFSLNAETAVNQFIESGKQVFGALGQLGFRDAVPPSGRRYSIPTDLINLDKSSAMRVDHVLANDAIEVVAGEVVQNAASNRASDHHPVMVEFRIRVERKHALL
jgi:endonuclease/exonuclease/phosphatase family metal-dependent hydrolase